MHEELFATLHHDHEDVRSSLHRLRVENDTEERAKLIFEVESRLLPHLLAEEKSIYPRLEESRRDPAHADAVKARAEHHAVRMLLRDLAETPTSEESFPAKVEILQQMVECHIGSEESATFRDLREAVDDREAGSLLERFRRERERPDCGPGGRGWLI